MARLIGENIILREYIKEDIPHINKFANDYEIVKYLSDIFITNHTLENTTDYYNSVAANTSTGSLNYIISEKESLKYLGQIDIIKIDWINRIGTLGVVIADQDNLDKGIGSQAIRLLLKYVFDRINLNKVELTVHEFNKRALSCYRKCGFVQEGIIRESLYREGKYYNTVNMGILKREFLS